MNEKGVFKLIKIGKERLNELLKYISEDNFKYGLIFKLTYVYGRNIGEVLRLKKKDVDLKHNSLDFYLPTESVSFMLHESIRQDLLDYVNEKDLKKKDYIFILDDANINMYSKKLNLYLKSFINNLNKNILSWHCPILVNRDFKNLRGQHLFMDGADVNVINELYKNKNIQSTKDAIRYKELKEGKFPCNSLKKVFHEYTDLNIFVDSNFLSMDLFTVYNDKGSIILEYYYDTNIVKLVTDNSFNSESLYEEVSSWDFTELVDELRGLNTGHYKYVGNLKVVKN